jgi:hypothetical protein
VSLASTPPPTSPVTPPPPPAFTTIFPGVTTNTDFAVLGLEASDINTPASALTSNGFSVRYDATSQRYLVDLPSIDEFAFQSGNDDASFWHAFVATGFYHYTGTIVDIFKPTSTNPEIQLAYTSFGVTNGYYTAPFGFFAFGSATPNSGVPVTGSASYGALIAGATLDNHGLIKGDATFQFNFGSGALSGHFDPVLSASGVETNLGSYNFVNTVFGVGSPTFSGGLSHSGASTLGAFDGRFTGPSAEELMARWTAPYRNPSTQSWAEMFGVMVGKKQ